MQWCDRSPRHLMQTLGTEWARNSVHPDFWILLAQKELDAHHFNGSGIVYTDVRFDNEADFIRRNGGLVIHIKRKHGPGVAAHAAAHASEAGVMFHPDRDEVISNDGTIAELQEQVAKLAGEWCAV
jgi:hypothetical protein